MIGRRCKARERLSRAPLIGRALRDTQSVPSAPDRSQEEASSSAVRPPGRPRHQKALRGLFAFLRADLFACGFSSIGDRGWARCAGSFDHRGHDCCQSKLVMSQRQQTRHYIARAPRTPGCTCSGDRGVPPGRYDNPMSPLHCHNGLMASCLEAHRRVLSHLISLMRM